MAFLTLSDLTGACEAVLFNGVFEQAREQISETKPYIFVGSVSYRNDSCSILVDKVEQLEGILPPKKATINICNVTDKDELLRLKNCFVENGEVKLKVLYGKKAAPKQVQKFINLEPDCVQVISRYIA
jgi:DNA polymerase III alpha subunit